MSTLFNKDDFMWDGMYLMYKGSYPGAKTFGEVHGADKCHPTMIDMIKPVFIARFKYGSYKPWKAWINFLTKNSTVEQYLALLDEIHPVGAMQALGYKGKT